MSGGEVNCHTLYFRNHTSYDLHKCDTDVQKANIKIFIFLIFSWVKGQKMAQKGEKLCVSLLGTVHHMIDFW